MAIGIVRRLDELGRIVIPKEMRRTLRISEGDELEIMSDGKTVTLTKYSSFDSVMPAVKALAQALAHETDSTVLFVTPEKVVVAEGKDKKLYAGLRLSADMTEKVRKRSDCCIEGEGLDNVFEGTHAECNYCLTRPIVCRGDLVGAAMMLSKEDDDRSRDYLRFASRLMEAALS